MDEELKLRLTAALERYEEMEHRIADVIAGNRMQLAHLFEVAGMRELRHELRAIAKALNKEQT